MTALYHTIVIGAGGIGSAVTYELARRGRSVLALDRYSPPHPHGSTHGETRAIRLAYFEHPDYVPLLRRAYELWTDLEQFSEHRLFHRSGILQVGPPDGEVIGGVLRSAAEHNLELETLQPADVERRFPGLRVPAQDLVALYERNAGYLMVEHCVETMLRLATSLGAGLRTGVTVTAIEPQVDGSFVVRTADGELRAGHVAVCAGPWAATLPGMPPLPITLQRQMLLWYPLAAPDDSRYVRDGSCPVFLYELPTGVYYGFPSQDGQTLKVGQHGGGGDFAAADSLDTTLHDADCTGPAEFLRHHLPGVNVAGPPARHEACIYTMSPDGHFIVDRHPDYENLVMVAGLSGHGYKFATVLGEAVANMVDGKDPGVPLAAFSLGR